MYKHENEKNSLGCVIKRQSHNIWQYKDLINGFQQQGIQMYNSIISKKKGCKACKHDERKRKDLKKDQNFAHTFFFYNLCSFSFFFTFLCLRKYEA